MSDYTPIVNAFGRGTAAGNAIFRCYARPTKVSTLDPDLLERLQHQRRLREAAEAAMVRPQPIPKSQAMINRPRVGRGRRLLSEEIARMRLDALPHKKSKKVIAQEVRARSPLRHPQFGRPMLNDVEKDRLGQIFQFGTVPLKPKEFTGANRVRYAAMNKRYEVMERYKSLKRHIDSIEAEMRLLNEPNAQSHDRQKGKRMSGDDILMSGGLEMPLRFPRMAAGKILERRALKQQLTQELSELIQEMREVGEAIRALNLEEEKRNDIDS